MRGLPPNFEQSLQVASGKKTQVFHQNPFHEIIQIKRDRKKY